MGNLYSVQRSAAAIAVHFGVSDPPALEIAGRIKSGGVKPGEPGIIVRQGAGRRVMQSLRRGSPRPQTDRDGHPLHMEPVNLVADLTNPMLECATSRRPEKVRLRSRGISGCGPGRTSR